MITGLPTQLFGPMDFTSNSLLHSLHSFPCIYYTVAGISSDALSPLIRCDLEYSVLICLVPGTSGLLTYVSGGPYLLFFRISIWSFIMYWVYRGSFDLSIQFAKIFYIFLIIYIFLFILSDYCRFHGLNMIFLSLYTICQLAFYLFSTPFYIFQWYVSWICKHYFKNIFNSII